MSRLKELREASGAKEFFKVLAGRYGLFLLICFSLPFLFLLVRETSRERQLNVSNWTFSTVAPAYVDLSEDGSSHVPTPEFVRGIYVSAATAGYERRFSQLIDLVERTELNAMVIDLKDGDGGLAFSPEAENLRPFASKRPELGHLAEFTAPLTEKGIYLIGRVFVFQDPHLAQARPELALSNRHTGGLWRDYRGIPWLDPASEEVWEYNVDISREAYLGGFDEIQFDYIRFPSDGNLSTIDYPVWDGVQTKAEVMADFFRYLDRRLRIVNHLPISVDLFGLTMWQHDYDLNIGQKLSDALPYFNFISPMVYPSHYPPGFNGYQNPALQPYQVVYQNMVRGQSLVDSIEAGADGPAKLATFRPWIQDFDLGAVYTPQRVQDQMRASADGGASGWLLWNARNVYTEAALQPAEQEDEKTED